MKTNPDIQIMTSVRHLGRNSKPRPKTNQIEPMTHQIQECQPVKIEQDTKKLASETGRILPLNFCEEC